MSKQRYLYLILGLIACSLLFCTAPESNSEANHFGFRNLEDSVHLVGMQTCRGCHNDVYQTYIETGMGQSFGAANWEKTSARFDSNAVVYDAALDYYYQPFFKDSVLYVLEFRLEGKDTTHKRLERIDYIIGSGHHTNSHLIHRNGYLYQAPITYYTQDGHWDLAPGFEKGNNKRFDRAILSECVTCHNHIPTLASGSENKYHKMPLGIECERCHGAGSLHVKEKLSGKIIDTSKLVDYSIVNPRHLPIDRQMDLCQRCHLQGVAVLNEGKTFYDFKPGMALSSVMNVFLPRFTDSDERFIMASQADRLRMSACFTQSGELSCISCHNPHHDVHSTTKNNYNSTCQSCHQTNSSKSQLFDCSAPKKDRQVAADDCVACHMPPSGSIDIPHVNITDHYIRKSYPNKDLTDSLSETEVNEIAGFLGLQSLVVEQPSPLDMAKGYLALWDKFMASPAILDSVRYYLDRSKTSEAEQFNTLVHYYFNKEAYAQLSSLAPNTTEITQLTDAWTAYRLGEATYKSKQLTKAQALFQQAANLQPYNLNFQEKLGTVLAQSGQLKQAEKVFQFILKENPQRKMALSNLGLVQAQQGNITAALNYYNQALALDPDYKNALLNKIGLLLQTGRKAEAVPVIDQLLKKYPDYKSLLEQQGVI